MTLESSACSKYFRLALVLAAALCSSGCCALSGHRSEGRVDATPPSQVTRAAAEAALAQALWSYHEVAITDVLQGIKTGRYRYNDSGGPDFNKALDFFESVTGIMSSTGTTLGRLISEDLGTTLESWRQWYRESRGHLRFDANYCEVARCFLSETLSEAQPEPDLIVIAELVATEPAQGCGRFHFAEVAEYTDITVLRGAWSSGRLRVVHGCTELPRSQYASGTGTLERFTVGDYHRLELTMHDIYKTGRRLKDEDNASVADFYAVRVDLVQMPGTHGARLHALGDLGSVSYPQCDFAACSPVARTISPGYTNGFLTSVPGWASSISYHPNGMLNQVSHSNGIVDTQANDPDMMRRPSAISAARRLTACPTGILYSWTAGL